jgi:AcrR family transcriptional regulator
VTSKPSRTQSEEVRKGQLLDAARKIFKEKSYESATVSEIATEAGLGKGTFYYYYPSKTAVAAALRDGLMNRMAQAVQGSTQSKTTFEEKLESLVTTTFRMAGQNADLMKLAFVGADETHMELHSESVEHAAFLNVATDLLVEADNKGELKSIDPGIAARLILGLIQQAVIESFVTGDINDAHKLESGVKTLVTNALVR